MTALAIGVVVLTGLITPGLTRYLLLGGSMLTVAGLAVIGDLGSAIHSLALH